ncbi:MAG: hypothetical protein HY063_12845 [Bacteroidetes bacterium]|nr:hypothetical protein [Bacteroidota bacterium]
MNRFSFPPVTATCGTLAAIQLSSWTISLLLNGLTMKNDKELKKELIAFIKDNEQSFADTNLDNFSVTALTIIKAGIDAKIKYEKDNEKK